VRWETEWSFNGKFCQKCMYKKLLKSDDWFSSYSRKWRCFFETQCSITVVIVTAVACRVSWNPLHEVTLDAAAAAAADDDDDDDDDDEANNRLRTAVLHLYILTSNSPLLSVIRSAWDSCIVVCILQYTQ